MRAHAIGAGIATRVPEGLASSCCRKSSPRQLEDCRPYFRKSFLVLGRHVLVVAILIVALVVGQTWFDWRRDRRGWALPQWASGLALAALVATPLTATACFASIFYQDSIGNTFGLDAWFWLEMGFALSAMGIVIAATRKKQLRVLLLLSAILTAALWAGLTFLT